MGSPVTMISCVGDDFYGRETLANFNALGVNTEHVSRSLRSVTGQATIFVDDRGRNCIVIANGANDDLTLERVDDATPAIRAASVVVGQLELRTDLTLRAFEIATEAHVPTFLNTAPALDKIPDALLEATDNICANEPEAELITGIDPSLGDLDAREAAEALVRRIRGRIAIITLGERGCVVARKNKSGPWSYTVNTELVPLMSMGANGGGTSGGSDDGDANDGGANDGGTEPVDTTGAGDCWMGAFAHLYFRSAPPAQPASAAEVAPDATGRQRVGLAAEAAARRACGVASISVLARGTQCSYPDARDPRVRAIVSDAAEAPRTPGGRF
jgi:sugar/nucleoside kinase (ribokinase family)